MNQHLSFQIKLAGKQPAESQSSSAYDRVAPSGEVADSVPDISMMVSIEKV